MMVVELSSQRWWIQRLRRNDGEGTGRYSVAIGDGGMYRTRSAKIKLHFGNLVLTSHRPSSQSTHLYLTKMFWRFGGYANVSTIDSLLDKPDITLEELLEDSDLLQELKQHNAKLIEYLREENVLHRLLQYIVADESVTDDEREGQEKKRQKYAGIACEILSSETRSITDTLMENQEYLREFWRFLERDPALDPLDASFFTKVVETLLDKKTEEMLTFIKTMDDAVWHMLQHVDCPVIMDLLLKMVSLENAEGGQGIVDVSWWSTIREIW